MKPVFITGIVFLIYLLIVAKGSVGLRRNPAIRMIGVLSFFLTLFFLIKSIYLKLLIVGLIIGFFYLNGRKNTKMNNGDDNVR